MSQLNARQWKLYNYLNEQGNKWSSLKQIVQALNYGEVKPNQTFNNSVARRLVTKDRQELNNSDEIEKIIICGKKGLKLASKEEATEYIHNSRQSLLNALSRLYKIQRKAGLDQQLNVEFEADQETIHIHKVF